MLCCAALRRPAHPCPPRSTHVPINIKTVHHLVDCAPAAAVVPRRRASACSSPSARRAARRCSWALPTPPGTLGLLCSLVRLADRCRRTHKTQTAGVRCRSVAALLHRCPLLAPICSACLPASLPASTCVSGPPPSLQDHPPQPGGLQRVGARRGRPAPAHGSGAVWVRRRQRRQRRPGRRRQRSHCRASGTRCGGRRRAPGT